jgi:hypothetical protein
VDQNLTIEAIDLPLVTRGAGIGGSGTVKAI